MTADEIKALVERLNAGPTYFDCFKAADALTALLAQLELATQELKNIANADTIEWDDPTQYEAWAKSRARHTLAQIDREKP